MFIEPLQCIIFFSISHRSTFRPIRHGVCHQGLHIAPLQLHVIFWYDVLTKNNTAHNGMNNLTHYFSIKIYDDFYSLFNRRYRYVAYRQFVRWIWEYLGKNIRVPLPACAVKKIRTTFPEPHNQQHVGFQEVGMDPYNLI